MTSVAIGQSQQTLIKDETDPKFAHLPSYHY